MAEKIANSIKNLDSDDSLAIGIESKWGSGKTSFVNLTLESLKESDLLIIKFNPWNFSDQNELIKDFFNSIARELSQCDEDIKNKNTNKYTANPVDLIRRYYVKLLKRSEITVTGFSFLWFNFSFGKKSEFHDSTPLEKQKEEINGTLKNAGKRIVIVIDDIDRLDKEETKTVFKLVKNTARFSNITFLLTYDRRRVCKQVSDEEVDGEEYLKKIIQMRFPLPKPEKQYLFNILFARIDSVIDVDKNDIVRLQRLFHSGFKNLFPTVRDIKRYINSIRLDLAAIGREEINPVDFLGVGAIRVFAPAIYQSMVDEKDAFIGLDSGFINDPNRSEEREKRKNICENIIAEKSPEGLSDIVKTIIHELFPQCRSLYSNTHYGPDWESEWRKELRVCSKHFFDRYFSLSVPSTSVSENTINDLLRNINSRGKIH